jgi:5-methylcytosine-specific restriction endonuclease McrA|uniref:HNH domain-containing protein n=1 Tax=viral metagenome TaxID=1070528 RepID=A0A6C0GZU4_9ZZZZ
MGLCQSNNLITKKNIKPKITINKKKTIPKSLKKEVWDKWVGKKYGVTKCLCCNYQEIRQIEFHCGHVISEKNGGKTNLDNLRPICAQCNLSMGIMNMLEFKKKYFTK